MIPDLQIANHRWPLLLPPREVGLPLKAAVGALQCAVHVVITGVPGTGIGFRYRHLIVIVGVLMTQAPAASGARPSHFQLTKPTPHKCLSISNNGHQPKLDGPQSSAVLCLLADLVQQLASRARVLIQLRDPGFTPEEVTARFSHEDFLSRLDQLLLGRVKLLA